MITYFAFHNAVYRCQSNFSPDYEMKYGFPNAAWVMSSNKEALDDVLRLNTNNNSEIEKQ